MQDGMNVNGMLGEERRDCFKQIYRNRKGSKGGIYLS